MSISRQPDKGELQENNGVVGSKNEMQTHCSTAIPRRTVIIL